ncbi:MAG TPA: aldehyde dehydrogenase family protein [Gemmatimonadaceae bacterium]|nr:aldehyde dehydrogenase family protein [Gemmatimonadaceae bacterium]
MTIATAQAITTAQTMTAARAAQLRWARAPLARRLKMIRELRGLIAENASRLAEASACARQRPAQESLTAEVFPLAESCRFLERNAGRILAPRRLGRRGRPLWLSGVHSRIHREPLGVILIIGPGNYPLFLPGVQLIQALAAGNAVLLKPGIGGGPAAHALVELVIRAGFDRQLVALLPESVDAARTAIIARPDKVLVTGSAATGRNIMAQLAPHLIPSVMELSGSDAVIIRADADLALAAKAIAFARNLNGGATCMSPARVFVAAARSAEFERLFARALRESHGGLSVVPVSSDEQAVSLANDSPFGLAASIYSRDESAARLLSERINAGVVTINDTIIPTADARTPFGGRGRSGFGATRGAEGLLELTTAKVVTVSRGRFRPAFDAPVAGDEALFTLYLTMAHARGFTSRVAAFVALIPRLARRPTPRQDDT